MPRTAIGSANSAEFYVTAAISATFAVVIGVSLWPVILGLVLGGVLAAPIVGLWVWRLPGRLLMAFVGAVVSLLSLRRLLTALRAGGADRGRRDRALSLRGGQLPFGRAASRRYRGVHRK